jgi:hypothetical protein
MDVLIMTAVLGIAVAVVVVVGWLVVARNLPDEFFQRSP